MAAHLDELETLLTSADSPVSLDEDGELLVTTPSSASA
jgi:hypothetical protein